MARPLFSATITLLMCGMARAQNAGPKPTSWLLTYKGKSTNSLVMDKRLPAFLRTHVRMTPLEYWVNKERTAPAKDALEFLHGPPDDVRVEEGRYVIASACVPHDCVDRGLLWVDTSTGATVFAASVYRYAASMEGGGAHLWLFTNNALQAKTLPATLLDALSQWSAEPYGDNSKFPVMEATLVQPDGTQVKLTPADVHAWNAKPMAGK